MLDLYFVSVFIKVLKDRVKKLYIAKDGIEGLKQFKKNMRKVFGIEKSRWLEKTL